MNKNSGKGSNGNRKFLVYLILLTLLSLMFMVSGEKAVKENEMRISYDELITAIKEQQVESITAYESSLNVNIIMKNGDEKISAIPSLTELAELLRTEQENGNQVKFEVEPSSKTSTLVVQLITLSIYIGFFTYMIRKMNGGSDYTVKPVTSKVRFSDVAGIDEEKEQLEEVVTFLKNPEKYTKMGAKIPKGILLNGDPGTGKTLLAKAIAGEAGVPFFQANGSSFEEKFVGVGASRIRKLFTEAKKVAPCIVFIDEIDSVAQNRYSGHSYSEQTLNQLLAEMDGFSTEQNVIVIAATNHMDILDPAIIRPGRFDRHVFIPMPDVIAREKILRIHARDKKISDNVSLADVAKRTVGFSGADLENLLNEAAIYSVNNHKQYISAEDIDEAIARVLVGLKKKNSAITDEEKWLTAVHEAGHAVVSEVVRPNVRNFGISIVPRGSAGGYNVFDESGHKYIRKSDLLKQMQVLYGGRVAEEIILGDISSGASNDLEKASQIAHRMVTRLSMNGSLLTKIGSEAEYNQRIDIRSIDEAEKICKENYEIARRTVDTHKNQVIGLAKLLYEKEYLSQEEVNRFILKNF